MAIDFSLEPTELPGGGWDMHRGTPRLNVCGANAVLIFERLGLPGPDPSGGSIDADDLLGRALVANVDRDDSATAGVDLTARWHEGGTSDGYFDRAMGALIDVAQAAKDRGVAVQWM